MRKTQNHIIRRQRLEVEVTDMSQAMEWQERLSRFANGPLARRLSELFDSVCPPNEVIKIDQLEVSAGMMNRENWEAELLDNIERKIKDELPDRALTKGKVQSFKQKIELENSGENLLDSFFYFLKNGQLPWSVSSDTSKNFEAEVGEILNKKINSRQRDIFRKIILSEKVRERLVFQFSGDFLEKALVAFLEKDAAPITSYRNLLRLLSQKTAIEKEEIETDFWKQILAKPERNLIESFHSTVASALSFHPHVLKKINSLPNPLDSLDVISNFAKQNEKAFDEWMGKMQNTPSDIEVIVRRVLEKRDFKEEWIKEEIPISRLDEKATDNLQVEPTGTLRLPYFLPEKETFVRNAGLIILHPFIQMFFEGLGISNGKKIVKPDRAAHLLQYLATGQEEVMEHELQLNKLLCGMATETPVRRNIRLKKKEKEEAETLLRSVIGHWSALGKTSVEGLRGTYLCREGKFSKSNGGGYRLKIENKAYDILLAELPWSISRVHLPWMPETLWVEW